MARLCDRCANYNKDVDELRQNFVDVIVKDREPKEPHFCPMYDDAIPAPIYYNNDACPYFRDINDDLDIDY